MAANLFFILGVVLYFSIAIMSITLHEFSHGIAAQKLGDPTPKDSGRLTLNPIAHIDIFGTIILPILLYQIIGVPFGYAKPVPINPYYFKNPRRDIMIVGAAGPLSNLAAAAILSLIVKIIPQSDFSTVLVWAIVANVILAVFNLIPIPPLDGSKVIAALLPSKIYYNYLRLQIYGIILILALSFTGKLEKIITPLVNVTLNFLGFGHIA